MVPPGRIELHEDIFLSFYYSALYESLAEMMHRNVVHIKNLIKADLETYEILNSPSFLLVRSASCATLVQVKQSTL